VPKRSAIVDDQTLKLKKGVNQIMNYDDDYPTCERTFATIRVLGVPPSEVSRILKLEPTSSQSASNDPPRRQHGWFLSSKESVNSRDVRRHLDWCLDRLVSGREALYELRQAGASVDISCYWLSAGGHGGPILSASQALRLAELNLDCGFDVYFTPTRLKIG
jgi:hypothetical protein